MFVDAVAARKVDVDLIAAIATARPGWSMVLVGPVGLGDRTTDVGALAALSWSVRLAEIDALLSR